MPRAAQQHRAFRLMRLSHAMLGDPLASAALARVLEYNHVLQTKDAGAGPVLRRLAQQELARDLAPLRRFEVRPVFLSEASRWTWLTADGRLVALPPWERPCTCCHIFTICIHLETPYGALWTSQLERNQDRTRILNISPRAYSGYQVNRPAIRGRKVFISYHAQRRGLASHLRTHLEALGLTCFDYSAREDEPRSSELIEYLQQHLLEADAVVLLEDPRSYASRYVQAEIDFVMRRFPEKLVVTRIADDRDLVSGSEPHELRFTPEDSFILCMCHWPDKVRELAVATAHRIEALR